MEKVWVDIFLCILFLGVSPDIHEPQWAPVCTWFLESMANSWYRYFFDRVYILWCVYRLLPSDQDLKLICAPNLSLLGIKLMDLTSVIASQCRNYCEITHALKNKWKKAYPTQRYPKWQWPKWNLLQSYDDHCYALIGCSCYFYKPINSEIDIGRVKASFRVYARHHRIRDDKGQVKHCYISMVLFTI